MRSEGSTKAIPTTVAPSAPSTSQPRYIASCAASGPGGDLGQREPIAKVLFGDPCAASTRSWRMRATSATGPPKPKVPRRRK